MTAQISNGGFAKYIGPPFSAGLGALVTWLTTGSSEIRPGLVTFIGIVSGVGGVAFSYIYRRYLGVLGAGARAKGSPARLAYDSLRNSLSEGNLAARLYARRLTAFLDGVDRFFGDAGTAERTLFPHAFGLRMPAPLWTAPAFDRCLLLALIYPFVTIFIVWAVSGHVGPAEAAFGLTPDFSGWERGFEVAGLVCIAFVTWRVMRSRSWIMLAWFTVAAIVIVANRLVTSLPPSFVFAATFAVVVAASTFGARTGPITGTGVFGRIASVGNAILGDGLTGISIFALCFTGVFGFAVSSPYPLVVGCFFAWLDDRAHKYRWQGAYISLFFPTVVLACLGAAKVLSPLHTWADDGPILLFVCLLTLLNAPFDWASLGLTRALLRRGLELGGWWPYVLSVADALLAAVIVATLAITLVIGVQAFDSLAVAHAGKPILPLDTLFDGLATRPTAPEFWWLYALLLSTMIPSLMNLAIGGASLMRGVPGLPSLLLKFMPAGKLVPDFERRWIALVLTLQVAVGGILGVGAQVLFAVGVIFYAMPWLGLGLLDVARDVAAFNLPQRAWQIFGGTM